MKVPRLHRTGGALGAAFFILAVGYAVAALFYYHQEKEHLRATKLQELAAIADLKVHEISAWRDEQVKNAFLPARSPYSSRAIRDWLSAPSNPEIRSQLESFLEEVRVAYGYRSILLLDSKGRVLLAQPRKTDVDPYVLDLMLATPAGADRPVLLDFHRRGPRGEIVFSLFTPIPDPDHKGGRLGFFAMEIDPADFLYPYIRLWPTPSPSAETVLIERVDEVVVYLNDLRHLKGSALSLRRSLKEAELPAVKGVIERNGEVEATDYRGVPVLTAFREVPGSPWVIVAKIDRREVYEDLRQTAILSGGIVLALIVATGATLRLFLQRERAKLMHQREAALLERDEARQTLLESERRAAEELRESTEHLTELMKLLEYAPVLVTNMQHEITYWNTGMQTLYGFSAEEAVGRVSHQLLKTVFPQPLEEIESRLASAGKWQGELHATARNGSEVAVTSLWVLHRTAEGNDALVKVSSDITPLKRAEAALRAGEEMLRFAADAAQIGTWYWDPATGAWSWSDWCKTLFAGKRQCPTTYEEAFLQLIHEDDRKRVDEAMRKALRERSEYATEMRVVLPNGEVRWLLTKGRGFYDERAKPLRMHGIAIDVTKRKEAERARLELAALVESTRGAIISFSKDPDGIVRTWNRGAEQVYGYSAKEAVGKNISFLVPPGYPDDTVWIMETIRDGGHVDGHETVRMKKNGDIIHVSITVSPIRDADGRVSGASSIGIDITDRKKAEERLRESEAQFRQLAETLPQLVWMTDPDGALTYTNRRWSEYTGKTLAETEGWEWMQFLHPDDYSGTLARWTRSLKTGEAYEVEYRLRRHDGEYRWFIARGMPIQGERGGITRWFGGCTDIEDQKRAREAAEAAVRMKAEFMANMSHEIRTPINGILGVADLLLDTGLEELQRRYLDMLKSSGEQLLAVVNDVLDFSKLEAGAMTLEKVEFDLRGTVEKSVESLAVGAFRKGLEMTVAVEPELPPVFLGDPAKLRQVILNLVGNAVKFTGRGEVAVHVGGKPLDGERWELRLSVTDTGIGIPKEKLGMIFESFTQAETTTSRTYGGTGLGLAIAKKIVSQMGGRLWAESAEGEGSTFTFEVELPKAESFDRAETVPRQEAEGLRVLVADGNETARGALQRELATRGAAVETASTGAEATRKAFEAADAGRPFDQIFIAARFPDMDGFRVAERLRKRFPVERLCTVLVTPDDIAGGARRALELGIAYVVKPVQTAALRQALARLREAAGKIPAPGEEEAAEAPTAVSSPRCTRVLLAEDNPVNLLVAETMLRKAGIRVTPVKNGVEALDAFEHDRFHLILMDVQMPEMDGFEATRRIREKGSVIPIVGLTAHALKGDRERCLAAGMDDYLPKPVASDSLIEKVAYWAQRHPIPAARPEKLLRQLDGVRSDFDAIVRTFLDNLPPQLAEIRDAAGAGDPGRLRKAAHRLKSGLSVVAADVAWCLAEELEEAAGEGSLAEAGEILTQLEAEMARVVEELSGGEREEP